MRPSSRTIKPRSRTPWLPTKSSSSCIFISARPTRFSHPIRAFTICSTKSTSSTPSRLQKNGTCGEIGGITSPTSRHDCFGRADSRRAKRLHFGEENDETHCADDHVGNVYDDYRNGS